ncbi:hypothetical protein [Shewanella oncorhynchi]|uniref:hypothetical protein n=1 Tax=Shewanella oncorhynchi TaxID=2726434 RepID=UPI003D7B998A
MLKIIATMLVAFSATALANDYPYVPTTTYDWQSNSSYSTTQNYDGSTDVRGYNYSTGSMWNSTIETDGDQKGFDSNGDYWSYDKGTGTYLNTNGTICTGNGAARICTE